MVRLSSRSLLWRGLLGIAIGIIAIAWPGVTVGAVVFIFAVLVFADSLIQLFRAFESEGGWQVVGHILLGLIDIAAGVVALAWPGITAEVLTIWIGLWAVVIGAGEFGMAFSIEGTAGERFLWGLTGVCPWRSVSCSWRIPTRGRWLWRVRPVQPGLRNQQRHPVLPGARPGGQENCDTTRPDADVYQLLIARLD